MVAAFPIYKLFSLAVKQLSKPLANRLKNRAKKSHFFRTYICMPPAQVYHWIDLKIKMRRLNLGSPTEVHKLNENMAIEMGAEMLGEAIVYFITAGLIFAEYSRSSRKEKDKEEARNQRFQDLEDLVIELRYQLVEHEAEMRHLTRLAHDTNDKKTSRKESQVVTATNNDKALLEKALTDATKNLIS